MRNEIMQKILQKIYENTGFHWPASSVKTRILVYFKQKKETFEKSFLP